MAEAVAEWAAAVDADPVDPDLVPGADRSERSALAALGGLARALAADAGQGWPEGVRAWLEASATEPEDALVASVQAALATDEDVLAAVYECVVTGSSRRRLGTFFTPSSVVDFMLDRAEAHVSGPQRVVDPGAGVGAFSAAARRRWPPAEVIAVDVNVVTLGLLGVHCERIGRSGQVVLEHADYLDWITTAESWKDAPPTLLIGNPPYTRHQALDRKLKASAREAAGELVDSGLAGLAAYFMAASFRMLRPDDALCFVLPGTWTEARYGRPLRQWLWSQTKRQVEIFAFPSHVEVFPGTQVTVTVLVVGPELGEEQDLLTAQVVFEAGRWTADHTAKHGRDRPAPKTFGDWLWPRRHRKAQSTIQLSEVADVRRGVATGANIFFFLRDSETNGLPEAALRPALRRLRHAPGDVLTAADHEDIGAAGHARWLLTLDDAALLEDPEVEKRIARGKAEGFDQGYLTSRRDRWYVVERVEAPDLFIALMSKHVLRTIHNEVKAVHSNSMSGVYLRDPNHVAALLDWLNHDDGQVALRAAAKHYSNGLVKLEPGACDGVQLPANLFD